MVIVFMMTPFIIDQIGKDLFGLWSMIFAVVAMFGLLDMGFATTAVRYVGEYWGSGDKEKLERSLGSLMGVYLFMGLVCFIIAWYVSPIVAQAYDFPEEQKDHFIFILRLIGVVIALSFPLSLYRSLLTGSGNMSAVNISDLFFAIANAILGYTLLKQGYGINGLAFSTAITMLGSFLAFIPLSKWRCKGVRVSLRMFSKSELKLLLNFSAYAFMANIAMMIIMRIDPLVIGTYLTLADAAIFAIAAKIAEYSYFLNKQFSNALMPLISQQRGKSDTESIRRIMLDGSRYLLAIAFPFITLLFYFTPVLIDVWVGSEFSQSSDLLRLLLVGVLVATTLFIPSNILTICDKHKYVALVMGGSAILNLMISLTLVRSLGLVGVALGTVISTVLIEFLFLFSQSAKRMGLRYFDFVKRVIAPVTLPLLPMFTSIWLIEFFMTVNTLIAVLLASCSAGLVYVAAFFAVGVSGEERSFVLNALNRRRSRIVAG